MQKQKGILAVILCLFIFAIAGCGKTGSTQNQEEVNLQQQAEKYFENKEYENARKLYIEL